MITTETRRASAARLIRRRRFLWLGIISFFEFFIAYFGYNVIGYREIAAHEISLAIVENIESDIYKCTGRLTS